MRRPLLAFLMILAPATLLGQSTLSGDWQATVHFFGSTQYATIHFEQAADKVTGTIFGTKIRMPSGIANSLQEALEQATTNLARWLSDDYKLTPNEVAIVLGTAIQYQIAEVVDPRVHVVANIDKKALAGLQQ